MTDWNLFLIITFFVIIGEFSTDFLVMALMFFCKKSQLETDIEREIAEIKSKMDKISMVDEFAKYARLQRKYNSLREELRVESKESKELFDSMKYLASFAVDLFWNGICSYIIWTNLNIPVLHLDPHWLSPLNGVIGWPSTTPGDVGILSCHHHFIRSKYKIMETIVQLYLLNWIGVYFFRFLIVSFVKFWYRIRA